jgi:DNA-directed RNA polymerase beta subunit/DNA-directed RNA polymerase beta' subunit
MRNFDITGQFEAVKKSAIDALKEVFPVEGKLRTLRIDNIWVDDTAGVKDYSVQAATKTKGGTWGVPVYASMSLVDKATGKAVDKNPKVRMFLLPKITDRLSYIVSGNEYQVNNQLRLKPGVYTIRKQNGELKTQVNLSRGKNFDLVFNESSGMFMIQKVGGGQANIPLYPILVYLGVSSTLIANTWGSKLEAANRLIDPKVIAKAAAAFNVKRGELKDYFSSSTEISPDTTKEVLGQSFVRVDGPMLLAAAKNLLDTHLGKKEPVDRDSLAFKELHSVEDFIHERIQKNKDNLRYRVARNIDNLRREKIEQIVNPAAFSSVVESFFTQDDKSNTPEQTNPLEMLSGAYRATTMGSGGITSAHAITPNMREIHPTHFGFLDPIHSPESNVGVNVHIPLGAIKDGKELKMIVRDAKRKAKALTPLEAFNSIIAFPGQLGTSIKALHKGKTIQVARSKVDYFVPHAMALFSPSTNLIPYLPSDQGNRAMMAAKMLEQAISLKYREAPNVQVGTTTSHGTLEAEMGNKMAVMAPVAGTITKVTPDYLIVKGGKEEHKINLYNNYALNRKSFLHHTPVVKVGDKVKTGQLLADNNFTRGGLLALGTNLRTAYIPIGGRNFDDGIVITESAAEKLTSEHIHKKTLDKDELTVIGLVPFKSHYPNVLTGDNARKLDNDGVIQKGEKVKNGDIIIAALRKRSTSSSLGLLGKGLADRPKDISIHWNMEDDGYIQDVQKTSKGFTVLIKTEERAKIGDKLAGRHGNKGVVTQIIPDSHAPKDKDGGHVEVMLNPVGVISRINIGQIYENAASKVGAKTGTAHKVYNFDGENYLKATKALLKKHGISDKEELFDPNTGKSLGDVAVGNPYMLKLIKQSQSNFSARQGGPGHAYDANMQPLKPGGEESSKASDLLTVYAMLSHGARANLREMSALKSTQNDEFWKALKAGQNLPVPKAPFVYDKFISYLKGAGIDVKKTGTKLTLGPLTDKQTIEMSSGAVKKPVFYNAKDMTPKKGGFFDPVVFGGFNGNKWGHMELTEPVLHPVFENAARKVTGLGKKFDDVLAGKLHVDKEGVLNSEGKGVTGGYAVEQILKAVDVEKELKEATKKLSAAKGATLDDLNKKVRYLLALKGAKLKPHEAYIKRVLPVVPTVYRPIYPMADGNVTVSDLNFLYQNTGIINTMMQLPVMKMLPEEDKATIRADLYNHVKGLSGLTDINIKGRPREGFISEIKGGAGGQPKEGFFISKMLSKKQDFIGRGTIIPEPDLGVDELGMPEDMAWKLFEPFVIRELKNHGKNPLAAKEEINKKTPLARGALEIVMKNRHVLLNRAPSLHKFSIMAFKPKLTEGKSLKIPPLINIGFNGDFDGDQQLTSTLTFVSDIGISHLTQTYGLHYVETRIMTARFREKIPVLPGNGEVLLFNLEDFPHGELIGGKEGEKGPIQFFKALPGYSVLAYDEATNRTQWKEVFGWSKHLQREIEIVTLSSGRQIITDDDPRAVYGVELGTLNLTRATPSKALELKMLVPRVRYIMEQFSKDSDLQKAWGIPLSFDIGYMFGCAVSNGWVEHRHEQVSGNIFISVMTEEIGNRFLDIAYKTFNFEGKRLEYYRPEGKGGMGEARKWGFKHKAAANIFLEAIGEGARSKHLPPCFLSAPKDFRNGLLAGLMDNDGSISISHAKNKPQLMANYTSASIRLVQEMQWLASSLGIETSITPTKTPAGEPFFCLNISSLGVKKWGCVGMAHPQKLANFNSCDVNEASPTSVGLDIVPISYELAAALQKAIGAPDLASSSRKSLYAIFSKSKKTGYLTRHSANRLFEWVPEEICRMFPDWEPWWRIVENTFVTWDRVKAVDKTGIKEDGYDLTVPGYETFTNVDGVILSNTMSVHTCITDEANREAAKMLPSRNLFQPGSGKLMLIPTQEAQIGLYYLSKTLPGRTLLNKLLPPKYKITGDLDKKSTQIFLRTIAKEVPPNQYGTIVNALKVEGEKHAYDRGFTLGLNDLASFDKSRNTMVNALQIKLNKAKTEKELGALGTLYNKKIDAMMFKRLNDKDNPLYDMIASGAKGSPTQLRSIMVTPLLVTDAKGKVVPRAIKKSYAEGLDLEDYWTSMYGARRGMMDRALQSSEPGAFSKDIMASTVDNVISGEDCGTKEGVTFKIDNADALDRFLAGNQGGLAHNTLVDARTLSALKKAGLSTIKVRSPLRCLRAKGTCAKCYGLDEHGHTPEVGDNVGVKSGQTIAEPLQQGVMNCSDGTIVSSDGKAYAFEDFYAEVEAAETYDGRCWTKASEKSIKDQGFDVAVSVVQSHLPEDAMYFIKTVTGHSLLVQGNHPMWVYDKEGNAYIKCARELDTHDYLKIDRSSIDTNRSIPAPFNPYFIGRYLADGCTRYGNGTEKYAGVAVATLISGMDKEIKAKTLSASEGKGIEYPKDVQIYDPSFSLAFSQIVRGRGAKNKRLQPGFNLWPEEDLARLLAGFIDGDSSCFMVKYTTVVQIYTSSYLILHQIGIICHKLNIVFTPGVVTKRPLQKSPAFIAQLRFNDQRVYEHSTKMQRVHFSPAKVQSKHSEYEPIQMVKKLWMWDKPVWDVKTETEGFTCGMVRNHNSFHTGGTTGGFAGYPRIKQLLTMPKIVVGAATLAPKDGKVMSIKKGLAGGFDVNVAGQVVHVAKGLILKIKEGQKVEAGDPLSDGTIRPQDLVQHKGMYAAQEYIANELQNAYKGIGVGISRKTFETIVRSVGNTTKVLSSSPDHDHLPGDIIPYTVALNYNQSLKIMVPLEAACGRKLADASAEFRAGHILEPRDLTILKAKGIKEVLIQQDPISHAPVLKGVSTLPLLRRDWMAALGYRYLAKNLVEGAGQAWSTDLADYHPIPAFAHGATFGQGKEGKY